MYNCALSVNAVVSAGLHIDLYMTDSEALVSCYDLNVEQLLFQSPAWSKSSSVAKKNVFSSKNDRTAGKLSFQELLLINM